MTGNTRVTARLTGDAVARTVEDVRIGVLGPLEVDDAATLSRRDRVVLTALAMRPGDPVSAERLADALWGDQPPRTWAKVVQGCVVRLRHLLGQETILTCPQGYRLQVSPDDIDAHRFERRVRDSRELLERGEAERAAYLIGEALALWRGRALADLEGWPEGRVEAERLEEMRHDAEELAVESALVCGRHRQVLADARALVVAEPMREHR